MGVEDLGKKLLTMLNNRQSFQTEFLVSVVFILEWYAWTKPRPHVNMKHD